MKVRKKPVEVEALQWRGMNHEEVKSFLGDDYVALSSKHNPRGGSKVMIRTLEGTIYADVGDWIIRGIQGEHYPCKPDIFEATYEPASGVVAQPVELPEASRLPVDRATHNPPPATVDESHRDLVSRLGFGNNITEPMADNDTIVAWFEERGREADEWREHERFRDECAAAGHSDDQDCDEHGPTCCLRTHLPARDGLAEAVRAISTMIDATYGPDVSTEAHRWRRCAKVSEECGEVVEALLGLAGENPRKGVTHAISDVRKELLDTALAALGAVSHLDGNTGDPVAALEAHATFVLDRLAAAILAEHSTHPPCDDPDCRVHGVAAFNRAQSEHYEANPRGGVA